MPVKDNKVALGLLRNCLTHKDLQRPFGAFYLVNDEIVYYIIML